MHRKYTKQQEAFERVVIALWSEKLHARSICPGNHNLEYDNGWFYFDQDKPFQWPELIAEARALYNSGVSAHIGHDYGGNWYILDYPEEGIGDGDEWDEFQRKRSEKARREQEAYDARLKQYRKDTCNMGGTERIMDAEWRGLL